MKIIAGHNVAFCFATMKCRNRNLRRVYEDLDFRLTIGLQKINDQWTILHEHHSIPAINS
ncbi:MAG: nuclear transport factor 2 family protein [Chitinophagales bacterium]|nr:nuclear transport factor 2 family protein [Chitinophagales bacterium]